MQRTDATWSGATGNDLLTRRRCLAALGSGTVAGTAGCLGSVFRDSGEVVLGEQEDAYDSDTLPYPSYGESFPEIELPDPLAEATVSTTAPPVDEETLVVTAFYAFCPSECLLLVRALADVQATLLSDGVEDVTFLAITFDPERDTPEKLAEYAERMEVDLEAGNWHYLRPEDADAAAEVVTDDLGIVYERDGGTANAYEFIHQTVSFLVNPDRYVERVYHADAPDVARVSDDAKTVAAAYR